MNVISVWYYLFIAHNGHFKKLEITLIVPGTSCKEDVDYPWSKDLANAMGISLLPV